VTQRDDKDTRAASGGAPDSGDLARRLAEAEEKAAGNWERFLRARADLENYRKRVQRDLGAMVRRGKKDLIVRLLDVVDALERAASWENGAGAAAGARSDREDARDADTAREGVALIHRQMLKVLADEGVAPIECSEAVATDPTDDVPAGTITAELQKGYTYEGEVLRPARVRVSQPPDS